MTEIAAELSTDTAYANFIATKRIRHIPAGFDPPDSWFSSKLKPFQHDTTKLSCRRGRNGCWLNTGLGKSACELSFADACVRYTNKKSLILTPLAVAPQFLTEAEKFGINDVKVCRENSEVRPGITVTNYDRRHKFDLSQFEAIIGDEVSIMKGMTTATAKGMLSDFRHTPYKLPSSATPSPNDQMEMGIYAEFVGAMSVSEMLSMFFIHDGGDTSKWRLKGHAPKHYYEWLASWSIAMRKPSDLGYSDDGYDLPPLNLHEHIVDSPRLSDRLFAVDALTLNEQRQAKRETIDLRVEKMREIITSSGQMPWIVWCELNDESERAANEYASLGAVEVTGSQDIDKKEELLTAFALGQIPILVTKGSIAGYGLNLQLCCKQGNLGISHSWELWKQKIARSHRFGQKNPVDIHTIISESEMPILRNIKRKQVDAETTTSAMVESIGEITKCELNKMPMMDRSYNPGKTMQIPLWLKSGW